MPASMVVGRGEAKAMATKQKASRAITKKELAYLLSRLCTVEQLRQGRIQGGGYGGSSPPLPESGRVYSVRTRSVT